MSTADTLEKSLLCWDGDNREFIVEELIERMPLRRDVHQVIRWAYGYDGGFDGTKESFEMKSNGSSIVADVNLLGNILKDPVGVGHDMLFHLHHKHQADPSGKVWTLREANNWYLRGMEDFGSLTRGIIRRIGLFIGSWPLWVFGASDE